MNTNEPMTPQPEMTHQQMMQMQQQMIQMQQLQQMQQMAQNTPRKTGDRERVPAILLALFLGGLGVHKFYLGESGMGIIYLLFCWTFIPAIVAFCEALVYLSMSEPAFDQKYNYG